MNLVASVMAKSSQTYAEEAAIRLHIFLLNKAMGWLFWDRTTPMAVLEASVVTSKGLEKSGKASTGLVCWGRLNTSLQKLIVISNISKASKENILRLTFEEFKGFGF